MHGLLWNKLKDDFSVRIYFAQLGIDENVAYEKMQSLRQDLSTRNKQEFIDGFKKGNILQRAFNAVSPLMFFSTRYGLDSLGVLRYPRILQSEQPFKAFFEKAACVVEAVAFPNKSEAIGLIVNRARQSGRYIRTEKLNQERLLRRVSDTDRRIFAEGLKRAPLKPLPFPSIK